MGESLFLASNEGWLKKNIVILYVAIGENKAERESKNYSWKDGLYCIVRSTRQDVMELTYMLSLF